MASTELNSQPYWEERFLTDWDSLGGPEQTIFFAKLAMQLMPQWLCDEITGHKYTICDAGCGQGESIPVLQQHFSESPMSGFDFSAKAIEVAQTNNPQAKFFTFDLNNETYRNAGIYDIIFTSNVLEHLDDPASTMKNLMEICTRYMVVLVPFRENTDTLDHKTIFTTKSIPLFLPGGRLLSAGCMRGDSLEIYYERQALLVYIRDEHYEKIRHVPYLSDVADDIDTDRIDHYVLDSKNLEIVKQSLESMNREYYQYKESARVQKAEFGDKINVLSQQNEQLCRQAEILSTDNAALTDQNTTLKQKEEEQAHWCLELIDKNKVLFIENTTLIQEKTEWEKEKELVAQEKKWSQDRFDNLYAYSALRDHELTTITASKKYKLALRIGKIGGPPYRFLKKIKNKLKRMGSALAHGEMRSFFYELGAPFIKVKNGILYPFKKKRLFRTVSDSVAGKRLVIFPPTLDWNMPLFQRPQQLAKAYAAKADTVVIYLTTNIKYDHVNDIEHVAGSSIWLINDLCFNGLIPYLSQAKHKILSISWTPNKRFLDQIDADYVIYEYIDELEIFDMYGEEMKKDHLALLERADVTVCTASKLYEQVKELARNPILSTNGGDYEFFSNTDSFEINELIKGHMDRYTHVLGYYGALASWFDYNLVRTVAKKKPNWLWILVGMNYDGSLDKSRILDLPNVLYIPPQDYKQLPTFLKAFDIATIPFILNEITLSTSPVKLFEYMSANKPILTSKMPECLKYDSVCTYENADEFINIAEGFIKMDPGNPYWRTLEHDALVNTWEKKTDEILYAIRSKWE